MLRQFGARRVLALVCALALSPVLVGGNEEDLKAALLLNFVKYTELPKTAEADAAIAIGVVGQPELLGSLQTLVQGKLVHGRAVQARVVKTAADVRQCTLVFFGGADAKQLAELLEPNVDQPVLLVGESQHFLARGGVVNLFQMDGRLSFEVSLKALARTKLNVSSKLLRLGYTNGGRTKQR